MTKTPVVILCHCDGNVIHAVCQNFSRSDVDRGKQQTSGLPQENVLFRQLLPFKGVVHSLDTQYISVEFGGAKKKFKFPAAVLEGFLEIV